MKSALSFCFLFLLYLIAPAQFLYVHPNQTGSGFAASQDSHSVTLHTGAPNGKLFLFFGGTGSSTTGYSGLKLLPATLGYDVISLSFPNDVAAASLTNDPDSLAFNKYRQELCFGTPVSDDVAVDTLNSIYNRTLLLIQYLDATYPSQNWGQYLSAPNALDWSKIAVGGHSQGSGHAAYLAKQYLTDRVLMFSGPNDYSVAFSHSANWLRVPGITPVSRHYSYLSLNDEIVDYSFQFANISGLGMLISDDSTFSDNSSPPFNNSHCLYTTQAPGIVLINHNSTIMYNSQNATVWEYMLTSSTATSLSETSVTSPAITVYPNPSHSQIVIETAYLHTEQPYRIYDQQGKCVFSGSFTPTNPQAIDISSWSSGIYFLHSSTQTVRFLKQ